MGESNNGIMGMGYHIVWPVEEGGGGLFHMNEIASNMDWPFTWYSM